MIICSCNRLNDRQLSAAFVGGARRPDEVYAACGCTVVCGRCTPAILEMLRKARRADDRSCSKDR